MQAIKMIETHPDMQGNMDKSLIECIEECFNCAQVCTVCADACLAEQQVDGLRQCIRLNLDCADICLAAGKAASRRTGSNEHVLRQMIRTCETACRICAEECEKHQDMHEHCRICAQTCRKCEEACRHALKDIAE